ncbi:MAG: universal stress protein [Deltaproteobacteria bacterium]|nr:universal stress protein [Deltaproteobacteria bacterium]
MVQQIQPIQRILVAVDFSANAQAVLPLAVHLAKKLGAQLRLLHVVELTPYDLYGQLGMFESAPALVSPPDALPGGLVEKASLESVQHLEAIAHKGAPGAEVRVRQGRVLDQILEEIQAWDAHLLVLSTHGWTGLTRLLMGSTTEKLVRVSPIPVMTFHPPDVEA